MIFQLFVSCFLIAVFLLTIRRARQGALRLLEGVFWMIVWVGAMVVIWRPEATTLVAQWFGIGRGSDFILYTAVMLLTFGFFSLALAVDRLEKSLTKLVEHEALEKFRRERETKV